MIEEGFVLLLQQVIDKDIRATKIGDIVVKDLNSSVIRENIVENISYQAESCVFSIPQN
jgi:hypothetical protein